MARRTVALSSANAEKPRSAMWNALAVINQLSIRVNQLMTLLAGDGLTPNSLSPGLSIDANAEDFELDNATTIRHLGQIYTIAAITAFDISASGTAAGDTITNNLFGAFWVFVNTGGTADTESAVGGLQAHASALVALAQWAVATNALPPESDDVVIGVIHVAPTAGTFTYGTTALTTIGTFVNLIRRPSMETPPATFALDAAGATFNYGACIGILGSGTRVSFTGKTSGVVIAGSTIANGAVGAYLFYGIADDTEYALQLGAAYASRQAALDAIRVSSANPYLCLLGTIIIENRSGATFTPGTTLLDASGITCTFTKNGPGANAIEVGRGVQGQPFSVVDDITTREFGIPA